MKTSAAFTLLEVLLVLALMALLSGLFVAGAGARTTDGAGGNNRTLQEAVQTARANAVISDTPVLLRLTPDGRALSVQSRLGSRSFRLKENSLMQLVQARFGTGTEGLVVPQPTVLSRGVRFYSDGTCDAFAAVWEGGTDKARQTVAIDPWSCTVLPLTEPDA